MVNASLFRKLFVLLPLAYPQIQSPANTGELEWSYDDPNNWGAVSPQCNGARQSPIHIQRSTTYTLPIAPLKFGYYEVPLAGQLKLTNNGHSVELDVPATVNGQRPFVTGGILSGKYEAVGVHFHWGSSQSKGSEHVIDNRRYDVEMHMVHKNIRYNTVAEAVKHKDGIAVLGIMFKIVNQPDRYYPGLDKIFNALPNLENFNSSVTLSGALTLGNLLGDLNIKRFFSYSGSLTTPNCAEAVTWQVFPDPLPISRQQIQKFWSIREKDGKILLNNFRPVQKRNRRPVFYRAARLQN